MSQGFNGQIDQQPPPQTQQQQEPKENKCKRCFTSKGCRILVRISVIIIALCLIGVTGVVGPLLLSMHRIKVIGAYIFCGYSLLFGLLLLLVQFGIKILGNIFIFLLSYYFRAVFIMFLGTLTLGAFEDLDRWSWIGYILGGVIILIGILHIIVGCCGGVDEKHVENSSEVFPNNANKSNFQQNPAGSQSQYPQQGSYNQYPQQQQQQQQGYDPNRSGMVAAVAMPETQHLAMQAGTVAGQAFIGGASREEAMNAAVRDQNVQRAAASAVIAGAQNEQVRGAAVAGVSNAASAGFGMAYDSMFD